MQVHLEGMGLQGSLLALMLGHYGKRFTWHDVDAPATAYKACTGAIYPSGSTKFGPDQACHAVWHRWHAEGRMPYHLLEQANYVFSAKKPPHEGRYGTFPTAEGLQIAAVPSYHVNAQELVPATRKRYQSYEIPAGYMTMAELAALKKRSNYIVTHGWGERLGHVYWGWARLIELNYDRAVYGRDELRPSFYFRPNKYVMCYSYPVPGTQWWYAGSSIIKQPRPAMLEIPAKYDRWRENFLCLGNGAVTIDREGEYLEGWRPAAREEDDKWLVERDGRLLLRPLWNSGVRHWPYQWALLAQRLGIEDKSVEGLV